MAINTDPTETPVSPASFTNTTDPVPTVIAPQVAGGNPDAQIFTPMSQHLSTSELKQDGTNWIKVFLITAVLLLALDAGIYGYNFWRGTPNPDLIAPIRTLLNR